MTGARWPRHLIYAQTLTGGGQDVFSLLFP